MSDKPQRDAIDISLTTLISAMTGSFTEYHKFRQQIFREISHQQQLYALVIQGLIRLPISALTHRFIDILNNIPLAEKTIGNAEIEKKTAKKQDPVTPIPPVPEPKKGKSTKKSQKFPSQIPSSSDVTVDPNEEALIIAFGCLFIHQIVEADRRFNRILQGAPKNIMALLGLASCARISHQTAKSLTLLERLNEIIPQNPFILNRMGMIFAELQQYPQAKAAFDQVFQLAPTDVFSHIDWAWYLIEQREFDQAKQLLLRGLTIDPSEVLLYCGLGDVYSLQELSQESLTYYQQATDLDDFSIQAWKNLGLTLMDLEDFEKAAQSFLKIEQLDKSRPDGNICFGWLLMAQEKYQEAIDRFKIALKTDPQDGEIHLEIAKCYEELGADPQQLQYLQMAVRFDTLNPEVHYALAEYYTDHRRNQNAKEAFQAALKLNSHHVMSLNGLALLENFEFEDSTTALNLFQQALEYDPKNILTLFNMSEVYLDNQEIPNAEKTLNRILEIEPKDANALYSLGVIAKDYINNYPTAEKYLRQAIENDNTHILAYMELIGLYIEKLHQYDKIIPLLEAMKEHFPNDPLAQNFMQKIRQQVNRQRPPPPNP